MAKRYFKFNGFTGNPYYADGTFTVGKVYEVDEDTIDDFDGDVWENSGIPQTEALFVDDEGVSCHEELYYFTEVSEEDYEG